MTPTIASTLAALSSVGNASVTVRLNQALYPPDVTAGAFSRHGQLLALEANGNLTISCDVDAWRSLREFSQEVLASVIQAE